MQYTKPYNSKKKMFLGGAMAVGQLALSGYNAIKTKRDANMAEANTKAASLRSEYDKDKLILNDYNRTGSDRSIFKKGGKRKVSIKKQLDTRGLAKVPNSKDIYKVVGPKHEQGGVDLTPNVEVENGEYVKIGDKGIRVLSDDNSFANVPADSFENKAVSKSPDRAFNEEFTKQELAKGGKVNKKGQYALGDEIPLSTTTNRENRLAKRTYNKEERMEARAKRIEDRENAKQDRIDSNLPTGLARVAPYLDNLGNAIGTLAKPKAPKPLYGKPVNLDSEVNVNPQISSIDRTASNIKRGVSGNFADPRAVAALSSKADIDATTASNELLSRADAESRSIKNKETLINQEVDAQNRGLATNYRNRVAYNSQEKIGELSANMANAQEDIARTDNINRMTNYQDQQLEIELSTDIEGKNAPKILMGHFDTVLRRPGFDIETSGYSDRTKRALRDRAVTLNITNK